MCASKIGFVSIAHTDYVDGLVDQQTKLAKDNITDSGYEIVETGSLVTDFREAEKAGKFLASSLVDGIVILLASWVECPAFMSVYQEIKHLPVFVLAFPMSEYKGKLESTGSYVSYAMLKGTLDRIGSLYQSALEPVDSEDAKKMIDVFCSACTAYAKLRRSRIGLVGYASMSMYTGTFDHVLLRTMIGPEVEQLDSYTVINIAEAASDASKNEAIESIRKHSCISNDVTDSSLKKSAGIYAALEQISIDRGFDAINVKCQYEFSKEYGMVACVPLSLLAEKGYVASCEGDILNTVSMMILSLLSGDTVTYGDAMNHEGNVVKLSTCGFIPFSMGVKGKQCIRNFMPHPGFTGIQCSFTLRPEKVTVLRLIEDRCGFHIVYFTGRGLDTDLRQGYMPALDVELDGDVNDLVKNYSGQHYAICYGDVSLKIESLAKIMGIKAIRV
ncbi:MAG: hypothetical protein ACYCYM_09515 [Saccharofermentanales bacterium]